MFEKSLFRRSPKNDQVKFFGYLTINNVVRDFFGSHIYPVMKYRLFRWLGNVVRMREPPKRSLFGGIRRRPLVEKKRGKIHMEEKGRALNKKLLEKHIKDLE